jgi:hypothetical protein
MGYRLLTDAIVVLQCFRESGLILSLGFLVPPLMGLHATKSGAA